MGRVKDLLPDDWEGYDGPDEPPCDHADYEVNWEGRALCSCGHSWWLSSEQVFAQERHEREFAEWEDREARKYNRWWKRLGRWIYHRVWRWRDQEIPF